jgi:hypothetical protein
MGDDKTAADDPSVAGYRATSPYEWGGFWRMISACGRR